MAVYELHCNIQVNDFIAEHDEQFKGMPRWERLKDAGPVCCKQWGELGNDMWGKHILNGTFDSSLGGGFALLFKKWLHKNYPCQDDIEARSKKHQEDGWNKRQITDQEWKEAA